jgi:hypothetical protein
MFKNRIIQNSIIFLIFNKYKIQMINKKKVKIKDSNMRTKIHIQI